MSWDLNKGSIPYIIIIVIIIIIISIYDNNNVTNINLK